MDVLAGFSLLPGPEAPVGSTGVLEALDLFRSDDLIGIGMAADAVRRKYHPEGVVSYIIDRNINYTNFCTEYCSFCAFYRPMGHAEGYVHPRNHLRQDPGNPRPGRHGVLMQGGLHPDLKIEWYEDLLRAIKQALHITCTASPRRRSPTSPKSAA
jgi:cyclic dehypoxanthinyl futalosine synthase